MRKMSDIRRYEIKYNIPNDLIPIVREYVHDYTMLDPHILKMKKDHYTVRSIYFDTPAFDFYYEKLDGLKVRKKIRVRAYNQENGYAFLEIKRKYVNCVFKERTKLLLLHIKQLLNEPGDYSLDSFQDNHKERLVTGKFLYNLLKRGLVATLLVVYEREAYVGLTNDHSRLTIDTNVRTGFYPDIKDLFNYSNFTFVTSRSSILELKFNQFMPQWMRNLTRELNLRHEPISKYCMGIDACRSEYRCKEQLSK